MLHQHKYQSPLVKQNCRKVSQHELRVFYKQFGSFPNNKLLHILHSGLFEFPILAQNHLINSQSILIFLYQQSQFTKCVQGEATNNCRQICIQIMNGTFQYNTSQQKQLNRQAITNSSQISNTQVKQAEDIIQTEIAKHSYYQKQLYSKQILDLIFSIHPKVHHLVKKQVIQVLEPDNIVAILELLSLEIQNQQVLLARQQILQIFNDILVPICVNFSQFNQKTVNLAKNCLNYTIQNHINKNVKMEISQGLVKSYLLLCSNNKFEKFPNEKQLKKVVSYMTLTQAIHCQGDGFYPQNLIKSQYFIKDIERLLFSSYVDPQLSTANSMAINIYGTLLKQLNLYNKRAEIFINLYSTLSCFGTHLIKDVWQSFYILTKADSPESSKDILLSKQKIIDILFYKIQNHDNANVIKFCLQSILKSSQSYELFNCVPDAVYNSLIRMLNLGMHYMDVVFHMDSKMFSMIAKFFCNFYNNYCKQQELEKHLRKFLKSIHQKLTFDHAIVATINCFTKITKRTKTVGKTQLQIVSFFIKKYYNRFPIRKRNQFMRGIIFLLKNHLKSTESVEQKNNEEQVTIEYLFKSCIDFVSDAYLKMTYGTHEMKKDVLKIIKKNYSKSSISNYIRGILDKILSPEVSVNQVCQQQLVISLEKIIFIVGIEQLQAELKQDIKKVYQKLYSNIIDFGDSLYKNCKDRQNVSTLANQLFHYKTQDKLSIKLALKIIYPDFSNLNFVKNVLNNLSVLINQLIKNQQKQLLKSRQNEHIQLVKNIFELIYLMEQNEESLNLQSVGAQFLQWTTDRINNQICVKMIIVILKARIASSAYKKVQFIEQSIYQIHKLVLDQQLGKIKSKQSQEKAQISISPILRLRLCVLTSNLLFSDAKYISNHLVVLQSQVEDFSDRYDFQNYDEVFNFIQNLFTIQLEQKSQLYHLLYNVDNDHVQRIAKCLTTLLESTLSNLDYGINTKQAITSSQCAIKILFSFAAKHGCFHQQLVKVSKIIFQTGQQYWMFQRTLSYALISEIKNISRYFSNSKNNKSLNWSNLLPLILQVICCEEYRGYDSAIVLQKNLTQKYKFYSQLKFILDWQADYEGVVCRFQFLSFIHKIQKKQNVIYQSLLVQIFKHLIPIVTTENKQKMFLTGTHKTKLKVWQCLLSYDIEWLYSHRSSKDLKGQSQNSINLQECLLKMLNSVVHNNLSEVRYYQEIFIMKMMINSHSEEIVTQKILNFLSGQLIESISQVNKNISFLVISGILLSHLLNNRKIGTSHQIYPTAKHLFNSLLSFSCSHVAYFRGLSQFFCLQQNYFETDYTKILAQNYKNDADAIVLQQKLQKMINSYIQQIYNWQISKDLLPKLPNLNNNVVSQTYYIQKMKRLGQDLIKEVKHQDGFLPYKDIWKTSMKFLNPIENQNQNLQDQQEQTRQETQIFQRKIDPTLDFIYFSKSKLVGYNMKILITGSKSIPLYGHLSRTGQIFGVSQLIVPDKSVIDLDQYKNVSCTAQKWLNITEFSNKRDVSDRQMYMLHLQQKIIELKRQNFQILKIDKCDKKGKQIGLKLKGLRRNLVLVVDSQNIFPESQIKFIDQSISFYPYFSQHVQASILIWQSKKCDCK